VNPITNKVYVANDSSNSVTVIYGATNSTATIITGTNPEGVAVNHKTNMIYVANKGSNNVTVIDGSNNVPPNSPVLSSPNNGAISVPTTTALAWNSVSGATSYRVQLSNSTSFSLVSDTTLTATSRAVSSLTANVPYYWRAYATNSFGSSAWSSIWSFTTVAVPIAPVPLSPSNGSSGQATALTLTWSASANVVSYAVQVSTVSTFASMISSFSGLVATNQAISALNYGVTFFWRANATNSAGTSQWSAIWSFTTLGTPSIPVLTSPNNGATGISVNTLLSWNTVNGATTYTVQLSNSPTFALVEDTTFSGAYWPLLSLTNGARYYWHVDAANTSGTSAWSNTWSFTVGSTAVLSQQHLAGAGAFGVSMQSGTLRYFLPISSQVNVKYYDLKGGMIASFINEFQTAGDHSFRVPTSSWAKGTYLQVFEAGNIAMKDKIVLMR
jgi:YVTN family beta-propeller protein